MKRAPSSFDLAMEYWRQVIAPKLAARSSTVKPKRQDADADRIR